MSLTTTNSYFIPSLHAPLIRLQQDGIAAQMPQVPWPVQNLKTILHRLKMLELPWFFLVSYFISILHLQGIWPGIEPAYIRTCSYLAWAYSGSFLLHLLPSSHRLTLFVYFLVDKVRFRLSDQLNIFISVYRPIGD